MLFRTPDKRDIHVNIFLTSQEKLMLYLFIRKALARPFKRVAVTYVLSEKQENNPHIFLLKKKALFEALLRVYIKNIDMY